ncbi:MAG: hypothetical protein ACXVAY_04465 [Mucilaginibacter sp.]
MYPALENDAIIIELYHERFADGMEISNILNARSNELVYKVS